MHKSWLKFAGGVAALCLLCCAAPLTALFVGGGAVAGSGLLSSMAAETRTIFTVGGVLAMLGAALLIHRRRCKNAVCNVPKP
jgi:LPXTG-motif cell wall-anchored protein